MDHKVCTKCGEDKPLSEYYKRKRVGDTLRSQCKACDHTYSRQWKAVHPERISPGSKRYYQAHKERYLAYRVAHRDQHRAWCAVYYRKSSDTKRAYKRAYYAQHKEDSAAYGKRYRKTVAGKAAVARGHARRSMRKLRTDAAITLTAEEWRARIAEYGSHCCWCGKELTENEVVMDHIVALANGGAHIASNVAPSCQPCNSHKSAQDWGHPHPGIPRDDAQPETGSEWL